ncbi:substrate-binding periplasmic protein [Pseudomonas leptonychotis]|uniref:substrate-binding periplasmic protein n=1 Tax=Pseudomonas leptonychotis TaxID=2448482 RepID=UPI00386678EC
MSTRRLGCLLLGFFCCHSAFGEHLRLVTADDYAPFTGRALPAGGMLTQVVHAALAQVNIDSTLDWQPWNRGYLKTLRGEYDATFPYVHTFQREQEYFYSAPLLVVEQHIFSRADDPIERVDAQIMQGRSVCSPLGWQPPSVIQDLLDQGVLRRHSPIGIKECARLVLIGRDDFFVADRRLGDAALQLVGATPAQMRSSNSMISTSSLHLIVPLNHPRGASIIDSFDAGLASLRASGEYQQVLAGYIESRAQMTNGN